MSFDINWSELVSDDSINESIKEFLDNQFQSISLPSFIDNLSVSDFSLGNSPPEIIIRHIGDPFNEFYEDKGEDDEKERKNVYMQQNVSRDTNSSDDDDDDGEYDGDRSNDMSITTEDPNIHAFTSDSGISKLVSPPPAPSTDLRRSRTALDPFSLIMGNNNLNYMHNYNMNYVGLGNLNTTGTHTGTDTPTNILNQNPYATIRSNPSSYYKNKDQSKLSGCDTHKSGLRLTSKETSSVRSENDIQLIAEVKYDGDLHLELTVNLLVNYPSPNFISLPIKLHVTDLVVHSIVTVAYLKNSVFFSFLCDVNDINSDYFTSSTQNSTVPDNPNGTPNNGGNFVDYISGPINRERIDIIKKVKIESEIGEAEQNALRNVGKVERFLVEQLRNIIRDEFAWPSWVCFDLSDDEDNGDDQEGSDDQED